MTERREHPRRHGAILRLVAGVAVSVTLAAPAVPALAEATATPASAPRPRDERPRAERTPTAVASAPGRSVRPRGSAAPVRLGPTSTPEPVLLLPTPTPTPVLRQPGQAPLNQPLGSERRFAVPKKPEVDTGVRVWPMRDSDYAFSQEFGCVQQISGFYPAAEGCPADRPVVHSGLDFAADTGAPIYAAASGWVTEAGLDRETGLANTRLVIQHEGKNREYATEYLHWISTSVKPGDYVRAGEAIAEVGSVGYSTGPHLHFAVIDFRTGDYIDPRNWLPGDVDDGAYREARRERPRTRFADRSAGVPDYHDPAPAPAPTRQPVPEGPTAGSASGDSGSASREERRRERRQRRGDRRERQRAEATATATAAPAEASRPGREDRVRRDRTAEDAEAADVADGPRRDRNRGSDSDRNPDHGGRDRRNDDGDMDRSTRQGSGAAVAAVPEATVTGALPDAEPQSAETPPATGPDDIPRERTGRPGGAR